MTAGVFTFVAFLLLFWLCKLLNFASQGFKGQFQAELKQVRNFLVLFSTIFLIRSVALLLTSVGLWPIFHDWYCEGRLDAWWSIGFVFEFLLYNIIPITHLSAVHHKNFKKEENWDEE